MNVSQENTIFTLITPKPENLLKNITETTTVLPISNNNVINPKFVLIDAKNKTGELYVIKAKNVEFNSEPITIFQKLGGICNNLELNGTCEAGAL